MASPTTLFVCPYCGSPTPDLPRCASCRGFLDPLSRQASQNAMGPWFIRNPDAAFQSGCSYETVVMLIRRGRVTIDSVLRGPTTHQFWTPAKRVPGIASLLGLCHNCGCDVDGDEAECPECHAEFGHHADRQNLGLMPVRAVPGQPVPTAAEAPRHPGASERAAPALSAEPPAALLRHVGALESQVRWVWRLSIVLLAALGVTAALAAAGFLSGMVRFDPSWGASPTPSQPESTPPSPESSAGPAPAPTGGGSPAAPQAEPPAETAEAPAREARSGEVASTPRLPEASGVSAAELAELRRLVAQDTDDSLNEVVRRIEGLRASGQKDPELEGLLTAARSRQVQRAMKGVR